MKLLELRLVPRNGKTALRIRHATLLLVNVFYWLRFRRERIPLSQSMMFRHLQIAYRALDRAGLRPLLADGTLLGAVRQGAFAGRPLNIDLWILGSDSSAMNDASRSLAEAGFFHYDSRYQELHFRRRYRYRYLGGFIAFHGGNLSVQLYVVDAQSSTAYSVEEETRRHKPFRLGETRRDELLALHLVMDRIEAKVFGTYFQVPRSFDALLSNQYGRSWLIPTSPQRRWREPELRELTLSTHG